MERKTGRQINIIGGQIGKTKVKEREYNQSRLLHWSSAIWKTIRMKNVNGRDESL